MPKTAPTILTVSPARRAQTLANQRARRLAQAIPTIGTDWDGCPIADPHAENLCENNL